MQMSNTASSPDASQKLNHFKIPSLRWWIVGLLFLSTVLNYIDRQTLSILAPELQDQFRMSNEDYAFVVNAFLISYTVMQAVSGVVLDCLGTRWGFALMFLWWSTAAALHRWAQGTRSLALFRFLLGMGEAGNWPGAAKAIAEWFPYKERGLAMGIFNAGSSTGALLAPPLIAFIALRYGWRDAFLLIAGGGMIWVVLWLALYYRPDRHPAISPHELELLQQDPDHRVEIEETKIPWLRLFRYQEVWGITLARLLTDPVWWFYVFWLPELLKTQQGFSLKMIGLFAWIPFLTADLGCVVGGWVSDVFTKKGFSLDAARKFVLAFSALLTVAAVFVPYTHSSAVVIILISVATLGVQSWGTLLLTLPADIFQSQVVASVSGLSGFGAGIGGVFFTFLTGFLVDHFSYKPVLIMAAFMHPLGFVVLIFLIPKIQHIGSPASPFHTSPSHLTGKQY
jgi:MFS transporter, ACS family, aldohexuronate transporter